MTETIEFGPLLLLLGGVVLVSVPLRRGLALIGLPGLVGFIALGMLLSFVDHRTGLMSGFLMDQIDVLAKLGIIVLLFRVGLESDLDRLAGQLKRAFAIWLPNVIVPAALVFALIWLWSGFGMVPAILAAVAASSTSIGVSVAVWQEAGALETERGALLLDVAELDSLSAVVLLGIVFAVAPALRQGMAPGIVGEIASAAGLQLLKIVGFSALCYGFSRGVERRISAMFEGLDDRLGPFVFAAGTVFLIAAAASALDFSMAIGALFAGLAFSRDPAEQNIDDAFAYVLALFGPFFFLSIGLSVGFDRFGEALMLAFALFLAMAAGKLVGAGLPAWATADRRTGRLIGTSMVPRAEIFLIVMLHGLALGDWAMPQQLYTAGVVAAVASCIAGPFAVTRLLLPEKSRAVRT